MKQILLFKSIPYLTFFFLFHWQLISDAGFQGEITSISTAAQQIEVFSRILKTSTSTFLQSPEDTRHKAVVEFAVSCYK